MNRWNRNDAYCAFKDDLERRKALATRVRWRSATAMVAALPGASVLWSEFMRWLTTLLH
jgi:hypothetical protein